MFKTYTPICNNNCTCSDSECMYRHYLRYKDRKVVNKICKENASIVSSNKEETNSDIRKSNCTYGYLCINDKCNYRHFLNTTGRHFISNLYNKLEETSSVSSASSSSTLSSAATVISLNTKKVIELDLKISTKPLKNMYDVLGEEIQEVVNVKKNIKDVKVPSLVVPEIKKFPVSFANIVKKSPEEFEQEKFDLMMSSEIKDSWNDY